MIGETVKIKNGTTDPYQGLVIGGAIFRVEGFWHELNGKSWLASDGSIAAMHYAMRSQANNLPIDDNVLLGYIDNTEHLVHISEIETQTCVPRRNGEGWIYHRPGCEHG